MYVIVTLLFRSALTVITIHAILLEFEIQMSPGLRSPQYIIAHHPEDVCVVLKIVYQDLTSTTVVTPQTQHDPAVVAGADLRAREQQKGLSMLRVADQQSALS